MAALKTPKILIMRKEDLKSQYQNNLKVIIQARMLVQYKTKLASNMIKIKV